MSCHRVNPETGLTPSASKYYRYELPPENLPARSPPKHYRSEDITPSKPPEAFATNQLYRKTGVHHNKDQGNIHFRYELPPEFTAPRPSVRVAQPPGGASHVHFG